MSSYIKNRVGIGHVPSYQISGIPYVTGTLAVENSSGNATVVNFQNVTKFVTVKNEVPSADASAPLRFGFSELGVNGSNYVILDNGESYTGDLRCSRVYLLGETSSPTSASVIAGLTGIDAEQNLAHNWTGSLGVG